MFFTRHAKRLPAVLLMLLLLIACGIGFLLKFQTAPEVPHSPPNPELTFEEVDPSMDIDSIEPSEEELSDIEWVRLLKEGSYSELLAFLRDRRVDLSADELLSLLEALAEKRPALAIELAQMVGRT